MATIKIWVPNEDCRGCNYLVDRQENYYSYITARYCTIFRTTIEGYEKCCPCVLLSEKGGNSND